jgi:hypothetical protein
MATPGGTTAPRCWVWFGEALHDGTYHQGWRIETTRRRPPRSGLAAPSWSLAPPGGGGMALRLARAGATGPALALLSPPPEHA